MECLDDNAASEFVSGSLQAAQLSKVESHLASCRDCRALVAALAGSGDVDTKDDTRPRERISESQAGKLPQKVLAVGDRVGRYFVLKPLGSGGMGVVFTAYDPQLDRKIALKLLRTNLVGVNTKEARARLKREAQAIAQLNHPNVVGVYDVGTTEDGDVYIAMEFVEGDTLTTWLKRWPRTWREILDKFQQAGRGLAAAHGVGLLHRDFKPDNVLVGDDDRVKVTDFGLARSMMGPDEVATQSLRPAKTEGSALHADLTATGTVLGTPRYMPPEQLTGPDIDARADQFSFCVALYEALFSSHPLPGATSVSMLEHGEAALPPPESSRVPSTITRAVMRGLQKERPKRFPTMAALMAELAPPPERSRLRFAAFAAFAVLLVGGGAAAVITRPAETKQIPTTDPAETQPLFTQIQQLQSERKQLNARIDALTEQLARITEQKVQSQQELVDVSNKLQDATRQLAEKNGEIQKLANELAKTKNGPDITTAVQTVGPNLENCFDEWSQRQALEVIEGVKRPPPKSAQLLVKASVSPDGHAEDAKARGELDVGRDGSVRSVHGNLSICVENAIDRVAYPKGTETLDVEVQINWTDPNVVTATGRVVGHHEAPSRGLDL